MLPDAPSAPRHRRRIWLAAGLMVTLLSLPVLSTADTGSAGETVYYGVRCFNWNTKDDSCPAGEDAYSNLSADQDPGDCPIIEVYGIVSISGGECCYEVSMEACYEDSESGSPESGSSTPESGCQW